MSTTLPVSERSPGEGVTSIQRENVLSIAFNAGLAIFLLGSTWHLCIAPSPTEILNWLKLILIYLGIGLASCAWVAGLQASLWIRAILIGMIVGGIVYNSIEAARETEIAGHLLQPGRLEDGRWVHAGLGVSLAVLPGWEVTLARPSISESHYASERRDGRLRLWPNERAVFFRIEPKNVQRGPGMRASSIRMEAQQYRFSTLQNVIRTIFHYRSMAVAKPGVEITDNPRSYRIDGRDFAEFTSFNEKRNASTRTVFARSGSYLLYFVLEAYRKEDLNQFQEFLDSIQITRQPTTFSGSLY